MLEPGGSGLAKPHLTSKEPARQWDHQRGRVHAFLEPGAPQPDKVASAINSSWPIVGFAQNDLMDTLILHSAELELVSDAAKVSEAVLAGLELASILEAIQIRTLTLTPVKEKILYSRPSSHWGINEWVLKTSSPHNHWVAAFS
jgi:hypothetical protein